MKITYVNNFRNLRGENKREKKLKGSKKEENGSVQNTEQKD